MTETPCTNDDCEDGWVWTQMGEFPEPCPLCNARTRQATPKTPSGTKGLARSPEARLLPRTQKRNESADIAWLPALS